MTPTHQPPSSPSQPPAGRGPVRRMLVPVAALSIAVMMITAGAVLADARSRDAGARWDGDDHRRHTAPAPVLRQPVRLTPLQQRLARMDRNRDGIVTRREFTGPVDEFRRLDTNRDGKLTLTTRVQPAPLPPPQPRPLPQPYHHVPAPRIVPEPPAPHPVSSLQQRLALMDRNRDGVVTRREFTGPGEEFHRLDVDHDGVLRLSRPAHVSAPRSSVTSGKPNDDRHPHGRALGQVNPPTLPERSTSRWYPRF